MSEFVYERIDLILTRCNKLKRNNLINDDEAKKYVKKMKQFEFKLKSNMDTKHVLINYLQYQIIFFNLINQRLIKVDVMDKKRNNIVKPFQKDIYRIFNKACGIYKHDVYIWQTFIKFAEKLKDYKKLTVIYSKCLQIFIHNIDLWTRAAYNQYSNFQNIINARNLFFEATRFNADSKELLQNHFKFEIASNPDFEQTEKIGLALFDSVSNKFSNSVFYLCEYYTIATLLNRINLATFIYERLTQKYQDNELFQLFNLFESYKKENCDISNLLSKSFILMNFNNQEKPMKESILTEICAFVIQLSKNENDMIIPDETINFIGEKCNDLKLPVPRIFINYLKNNEITLKESLATLQNVNSQSCVTDLLNQFYTSNLKINQNLILFNHIFTFFITENNFKQFWNIYKDIRIKEYENVELLKELYFDQLIYMSDKIEACTLLEQMKMLVNIPFSKLLIVKYINFLESTEKFISASAEYEKLISYYQSDVDVWIDYVLFAKKYYTHFDSNFIDKIYTKAIKILSPEHGNLFLSKYTLIHL